MFSILPSLPRPLVRAVVGIWRRRWLVLAVAWVVAVAGWLATIAIPDVYEGRAQVYINTDTALEAAQTELGARANLEKSVRIVRTQLFSRDTLEQVIYDAGLDGDIYGPIELERRVNALADAIEVEPKEEQYFEITFRDQDRAVAQAVVSSVLGLFIERNVGAAISDVSTALRALDNQIEERTRELQEIEDEIADYRAANASDLTGSDRVTRRLEIKEAELARTQDQIARLQLTRTRLRGELSATPATTSGDELDALKVELAQLLAQYNENYPDVPRLRARIAELEAGGVGLPDNPDYLQVERQLNGVNDELASLVRQERRVEREIQDLELSAAQTPEAEAELTRLLRERERVEANYKALRAQRDDTALRADFNADGAAVEYTVYEAPRVSNEPVWPPRGLMTLGVFVLSLGVGAGLAYLLSQVDRTYTQGADLEQAFGLPILGSVSPSPTPASRTRAIGDRLALGLVLGTLMIATAGLYYMHEVRPPGATDTAGAAAALLTEGPGPAGGTR